MTDNEFLKKIADIFGRANFADFSMDERRVLLELFDEVSLDGFEDGYADGYADGQNESEEDY